MKNLLSALVILLSLNAWSQFPELQWEYPIGAPCFGSPSAADLDNDGFYEIVFTTYTNDGRAHCINAEDGSVKWIYDIGGCGDVAPLIYDMNQDGVLDVVVNGSCNPTIFCIDGNSGDLLWSMPSGGGDSPPTAADMDGDGMPEVLFGNFNGELRILNGEDGTLAQSFQVTGLGALQTEPTLADVDDDGDLDILAANYFYNDGLYVWAFDFDGNMLWENQIIDPEADLHAYHGGAVADIDNDGKLEYVIGSGAGYVQALNIEDGSELWNISVSASNMSAITIADLDDDGELEVVFNNNDYLTFDDRIWVLDGATGEEEWSYPITFSSFRGMAVSDINGNGQLDLVSGHFMGKVRAIEPYNGLIWEINLLDYFEDGLPWFEADSQPLIADFDQNGTMDVFVSGGYGTYTPDAQNTGSAFMLEAGVGTCPEWLMFRHDVHRTGYLSAEEVEEACEEVSIDENASSQQIEIYPNPTDDLLNISVLMPGIDVVDIQVTDLMGKQVLVERDVDASRRVHYLETQYWAPGLYTITLLESGQPLGNFKAIVK
jgi:outer membrane protein assembly factor BamB